MRKLMTLATMFVVGTSLAAQPPVPPVRRTLPVMQRGAAQGPAALRARAFSGRGGRAMLIQRRARGPLGRVEQALRARERLGLTEDQVARLEALRTEVLDRRSARAGEIAELRSQVRAGQADRGALRGRLRAQRGTVRRATDPLGQILTEEQRAQLRPVHRRDGAPGIVAGPRGPAQRGAHRAPFRR